jgi:hypothetical protein
MPKPTSSWFLERELTRTNPEKLRQTYAHDHAKAVNSDAPGSRLMQLSTEPAMRGRGGAAARCCAGRHTVRRTDRRIGRRALGPRWALGIGAAAGFAAAIVAIGVLCRSGGEAEHAVITFSKSAFVILNNARHRGRIAYKIDPPLDRHEVKDGSVVRRE